MPSPYIKGIHEKNSLPHRGFAPQGLTSLAPIRVKAPEVKPRKTPLPELGDSRATERHDAALSHYRVMTPQERADWIYGLTTAPYVPPFIDPKSPMTPAPTFYPRGTITQWEFEWHGPKCEPIPFIGPLLANGDAYTPKPRKPRA